MTRTASGPRNAPTSSGRTIVRPSGFRKSDAIFATSLFGPTPAEQVEPLLRDDLRLQGVDVRLRPREVPERGEIQVRFINAGLLERIGALATAIAMMRSETAR